MPMPPLEALSMRVFLSESRVYAALNATSVYAGKKNQSYGDMAVLVDCGALDDYVYRNAGMGTCIYQLCDVLSMLQTKHYYAEATRLRAAFTEVDWPGHLYLEVL